jgi:hypothetical protein
MLILAPPSFNDHGAQCMLSEGWVLPRTCDMRQENTEFVTNGLFLLLSFKLPVRTVSRQRHWNA